MPAPSPARATSNGAPGSVARSSRAQRGPTGQRREQREEGERGQEAEGGPGHRAGAPRQRVVAGEHQHPEQHGREQGAGDAPAVRRGEAARTVADASGLAGRDPDGHDEPEQTDRPQHERDRVLACDERHERAPQRDERRRAGPTGPALACRRAAVREPA